jgi:hypothetical protein
MAQKSMKLMSKGLHRCADVVGMIMAQFQGSHQEMGGSH